MRLAVKKYAGGGWSAFETTNDGGEFIGQLGGEWEVGQRISAYVEATCDDTEEGAGRLLAALSWLRDEVERRKRGFAEKKEGSVVPPETSQETAIGPTLKA
jgi:hypothetical protein